jgi:hypothetical protein
MAFQADPERGALDWYERRRDEFLAAAEYARREENDAQLLLLAESFGPFFARSPYWQEGETVLTWAVDAAKRMGKQPALAGLLSDLGVIHRQQTLLPRAAEDFADAYTTYERLGDNLGQARALFDLGLTQSMLDATADARESLEHSVALWRDALARGEKISRVDFVSALGLLGVMLGRQGESALGRAALQEALDIGGQFGGEQERADSALERLGQLAEQADPEAAARFYSQALDARRQRGDSGGIARLTGRLLDAYLTVHRFAEARALLSEAINAIREFGDREGEVWLWLWLEAARLELASQNYEAAGEEPFGMAWLSGELARRLAKTPELAAAEPEDIVAEGPAEAQEAAAEDAAAETHGAEELGES